jgi:hypothetical protein
VHQPAGDNPLVVKSDDGSDTNSVTIESEGGTQAETVDLPGGGTPNTTVTPTSFGDVDAVFVEGQHKGDITIGIDDGTGSIGTELLQNPLTGVNVDGVSSVEGIPALGEGSRADPITGDGTLFLETTASFVNEELGERLHTLDLDVSLDTSREALASSRRQTIDVGQRSVEFEADLGGRFESAKKIKDHFRDLEGDLIYAFSSDPSVDPAQADRQIVARNCQIVDAPDVVRSAGDTNFLPGVTFVATGDPAIEIINNA